MTSLRRLAGVMPLAALSGLVTVAQDTPVPRTQTGGVRINVQVSDGGRPVSGLRLDDFELLDKGVSQRLDAAESAVHVAVALAIDTSLSSRDESMMSLSGPEPGFFQSILHASDMLLRALDPGDRAAIVAVADRVIPVVTLTDQANALQAGLRRVQSLPPRASALFTDGRGTTTYEHEDDGLMPQSTVWDGAFAAASLVARDPGLPLVVVVSDGIDDGSWLPRDHLSRTLANLGIAVDLIQTTRRRWHTGNAVPEDLPKETGGTRLKTDDSKLTEKLRARFAGLRQAYVLTYEPRGVGTNDGWHDVVVKVKGRNVTVKARPGYYANQPAKESLKD